MARKSKYDFSTSEDFVSKMKKIFQSCIKEGYSQRIYSKVNKENKLDGSKTAICDAETQYKKAFISSNWENKQQHNYGGANGEVSYSAITRGRFSAGFFLYSPDWLQTTTLKSIYLIAYLLIIA